MKQIIFVLLMLTLAMAGGIVVDWSIPIGTGRNLNIHPHPTYNQIEGYSAGVLDAAHSNPPVGTDDPNLGAVFVDFSGITDAYAGQIAVAGLEGCYIQDCALLSYPGDYVQCETTPPENYAALEPWANIDTEGYITHLMFRTNEQIPEVCEAGSSWGDSWEITPPCPMEGERVVRVTCKDKAGNIASQLQDSINLDLIDPEQTISYTGGPIIATTLTIATNESDWGVAPAGVVNDGVVQVDEKIDGGAYDGWTTAGACTGTTADCVYTFPAECKWYKFRYRVRDLSGRPLDEWLNAHEPGIEAWHDKTAPTSVTVGGAPGSWQNTSATATIAGCNDNCGCNSATYAFKVYEDENEPVCSTTYGEYVVGASASVTAHAWVCAAAKDDAGNEVFSSPVEFWIDKVNPGMPTLVQKLYDKTGLPELDWGAATDYGDQGGTGGSAGLGQYQLQIARDQNWTTDPVGTDDDGVDQYITAPTSIYDTNNYVPKHNCTAGTAYGGLLGMTDVVLCQGGWVWRVRAQDTAGNWGSWAEEV